MRIGEYVADNGMEGEGDHRAARDLLMAVAPRLRGQALRRDGEATLATAIRVALNSTAASSPCRDRPGPGKTYTGARMICALAREGKKVGITANSHKVIRNLLDEARSPAAGARRKPIRCIQKISDTETDRPGQVHHGQCGNFSMPSASLPRGGGTAWFWARPDARR